MTQYVIKGPSTHRLHENVTISIEATGYGGYRCMLVGDNQIIDVTYITTLFDVSRKVTSWQMVYFNKVIDNDFQMKLGELKYEE